MATAPTSATAAGTAGILQSLGIGSGLDIGSIVSQLVTADTAGDNSRIARETSQVGTQISAIGQLKGALSSFQTALNGINTPSAFQAKAASSADNTVYTASADGTAAAGSYQVEVTNLAQSNQILSKPYAAGSSTVVGTGDLTLSLGSSNFVVKIDSNNDTLAGIRDAINSASDNPGVSATIVNGASGAQLVLTSTKTGAANTIAVNTDSASGLSSLIYNPTTTGNYTLLQAALDSNITVAGVVHSSASNTVTDAIDGVTINLVAAKPGTKVLLNISDDTGSVIDQVQNFVSAYNTLKGVLTTLGSYNSDSQTAGPLLGDSLETNIESQLSRGLTSPVAGGGAYNSLASLGITTNQDGTLSLDQTKLKTALNTNFNAVSAVFSSATGVATQLSSFVSDQLSSTGGIATRNSTLTQQQKDIADEQTAVTARALQLQTLYQAQFSAMDTLLAQMQQTSSFITQQFASIQSQTLSSSLSS